MNGRIRLGFSIAALLAAGSAGPLEAKTVVCVDGGNDRYVSSYERYIRTRVTVPPDIVQVGTTLNECMAKVAKGDELIIICHGRIFSVDPPRSGFRWGGNDYSGFGAGTGAGGAPAHKVPAGFAALNGVKVTVAACYSTRDPDEAGPHVSVAKSLQNAMTGGNNTVGGYAGRADAQVRGNVQGGLQRQREQAEGILLDNINNKNPSWADHPPPNRSNPPPEPNQQSAAQALVDARFPGKGLTVVLRNPNIVDDGHNPFAPRLAAGASPLGPDEVCGQFTLTFEPIVPGPAAGALVALSAMLAGAAWLGLRRTAPARRS